MMDTIHDPLFIPTLIGFLLAIGAIIAAKLDRNGLGEVPLADNTCARREATDEDRAGSEFAVCRPSEAEDRTEQLNARVSAEERKAIRLRCVDLGISLGDYLVTLAFRDIASSSTVGQRLI